MSQGSLQRPTLSESPSQRVSLDAGDLRPFGKRLGFPAVGQQMVAALVSPLLSLRGPSDIPSFVIPVDVNPVNRVSGCRSRPHVGVELLERRPFWTDRDPAPAVVSEADVVRITAPIAHVDPRGVLRSVATAVCGLPISCSLCSLLAVETPARFRVVCTKTNAGDRESGPAIAPADPSHVAARVAFWIFRENHQAAKPLAGGHARLLWHRDLPLTRNRGASPGGVISAKGATSRPNYTRSLRVGVFRP